MDAKDNDLLFLLEKDCMLPLHELAVMLQCSEEEIVSRREKLEEKGIICGYTAHVNWDRAGTPSVMAIVELRVTPEHEHGYDRVAERIARFSNVRSLRLRTGTHDLQLLVQGKTMQDVSSFVSEHIASMERVTETATHIIMKIYKENGVLYYEKEDGNRLPFSF
jgi:DNA-binding Lrp family transcriptional regulator